MEFEYKSRILFFKIKYVNYLISDHLSINIYQGIYKNRVKDDRYIHSSGFHGWDDKRGILFSHFYPHDEYHEGLVTIVLHVCMYVCIQFGSK